MMVHVHCNQRHPCLVERQQKHKRKVPSLPSPRSTTRNGSNRTRTSPCSISPPLAAQHCRQRHQSSERRRLTDLELHHARRQQSSGAWQRKRKGRRRLSSSRRAKAAVFGRAAAQGEGGVSPHENCTTVLCGMLSSSFAYCSAAESFCLPGTGSWSTF